MPSQGSHQGGFVFNNDHRAPWQQGMPIMDDRFPGQQMQMAPPQFQQNAHIPGYRSNWGPNNFHHPPPFNNYQSRFWNRNHNNAGSSRSSSSSPRSSSSSSSSSSRRGENESDMCFICRDLMQNCDQLGVHLCDGGKTNKSEQACEINARLEKALDEIKASLKDKHDSLTEAIEEHVSTRIGEIETIHQHAMDKKATLISLKQQLETRTAELEKMEKEVREKEKKLEQEKDKFDKDMHKEKEEICRQWQQLRDELARMEEMHDVQKGRIRLDIGGNIFTTSRLTLTQDPESMLAAMFSGRHNICTETDGTVFIDRDGTHFRYILNYLRDGRLNTDGLPRNRQVLRELRNEATYYQLHSMLQEIEKLF
ncbi:uncharacterized protein [Argopecten irradians]|uniref:uncharacterized protein n=1 Tax=Argopecten irradians TaxID=31199 RepID=UPI00371645FF